MKKNILIFGLFASFLGFAQQEIKIDIADALVIKSLELSYEKYIDTQNSFGVSALFNLAKQNANFRYNENIMITPYFRHYFTSDTQWCFFGELFAGVNSGKIESVKDSGNYDISYTDAALGIAAGTKYVSKSGLLIDVYVGLGRNLFESQTPLLVPRIGLNIGWRFF